MPDCISLRMRLLAVAALLLLCLPVSRTGAQSSPSFGQYGMGWNLAGGPVGTDFSAGLSIFTYDGSGYAVPPSPVSTLCTGYWVYFDAVPTVALAASQSGSTQDCPLRAGWTMVGNPFDVAAAIPTDVTGLHWNPQDGTWHEVHTLAPGGAVFIYRTSPGTVTLKALAPPKPVIEIEPMQNQEHGPYALQVGDTVRVSMPAPYVDATADPGFLQLLSHGVASPPASCSGASCVPTYTWEYLALRAGTTNVVFMAACRKSTPPCMLPDRVITLDIGER